ncbi:MAG: hypothetical protein BWY26_00033 [Elusimicrobia bacterium ADurb.Bin231]|nr:MAG: hypothetical protein BWY26_00033 [Elusimicrobia bacterium ADurb.Bin231]
MLNWTPETAGSTVFAMVVGYFLTLIYSIYMAFLNHKQSKVKDELMKTNMILERIEKILASQSDR